MKRRYCIYIANIRNKAKGIFSYINNQKNSLLGKLFFIVILLIEFMWIISYYSMPLSDKTQPILDKIRPLFEKIPVNIFRFLLIVTVLCGIFSYIKSRNNKPSHLKSCAFINSLEYFILPFYQFSSQRIKILWLLISLLGIPFAIVLFYNDFRLPEWFAYLLEGELDEPVFWGVWFSILGIIFTIRVYLEFIDKQKHSLGEFLMLVNSFLDKTNNGDEIKILIPTLYIGALTERNFFTDYKNKLFHICKNSKTNLSFLDYEKEVLKHTNSGTKSMACRDFDNLDSKIENFPLFKFHNNWFPRKDPKKYASRKKYYEDMFSFLSTIENSNATVNLIKFKYFASKEDDGVGRGNEDLFMFLNINKGIFYIGHMKIMSQTSLHFEASLVENKHLSPYLSNLYDDFIKDKTKQDN